MLTTFLRLSSTYSVKTLTLVSLKLNLTTAGIVEILDLSVVVDKKKDTKILNLMKIFFTPYAMEIVDRIKSSSKIF